MKVQTSLGHIEPDIKTVGPETIESKMTMDTMVESLKGAFPTVDQLKEYFTAISTNLTNSFEGQWDGLLESRPVVIKNPVFNEKGDLVLDIVGGTAEPVPQ